MYCTPARYQIARKHHVCMNCGEPILPGEEYARWACYEDGKCGTNKMHQECLEDLQEWNGSGTFEYTEGQGERPEHFAKNSLSEDM